jgi:hypothetical protein
MLISYLIVLSWYDLKNSAWFHLVHFLYYRLPPKNVKIIIYKTIILAVVLYGCETWSLTLREEG